MTHELKSPIAGLRAAAEILSDVRATPDEMQRFLGHITEQTGRLSDIVDHLLDLAHVETTPHLAGTGPMDMESVIRREIATLDPRAGSADVRFDVSIGEAGSIVGDAFLVGRALANLLENALAFSPAGASIDVQATRGGESLTVTIRDRGPGIPDYAVARVFERFYSLPRPDGSRGTGLGLPFVREIARLHGGRLELVNVPAGGCEAHLVLGLRS
ncbi:MAG: hypothetical protein IPK20_17445 [Betaproteobacteria bacterium]|nr:hypothetical protein [Betaproteobacteria bacterium]